MASHIEHNRCRESARILLQGTAPHIHTYSDTCGNTVTYHDINADTNTNVNCNTNAKANTNVNCNTNAKANTNVSDL